MRSRLAGVLALAVAALAVVSVASAWAQQKMPRVGVLGMVGESSQRQFYERFYRTLRNQGWIEGRNVAFVYASVPNDPVRIASAAGELVRLEVDVIFADSAPAVRASAAASRTIPIVGIDFTSDPVAAGYAASYGRPGGNVTGVFLDAPEFSGTWLDVLRAAIPGLSRVAALWDPSPGDVHLRALQAAAQSAGIQLQVHQVRNQEEIEAVFFGGRPQALVLLPSPLLHTRAAQLAKMAMRQRMPATAMPVEFAEAGGLVAYGPEVSSVDERCASLVSSILRGAKPGDLPIERPAKFQLVVNLKAAKALNLTIPASVLARADRVIR